MIKTYNKTSLIISDMYNHRVPIYKAKGKRKPVTTTFHCPVLPLPPSFFTFHHSYYNIEVQELAHPFTYLHQGQKHDVMSVQNIFSIYI